MKNTSKNHQLGMTLIEIMIALLIGAFLLGGLLQIFIGNKQSYRLDEGQSRLQENARYALELLSHDIRLSGYLGCSGASATNPVIIANAPLVAPLVTRTIAPNANPGDATVITASIVTGGNDNTGSFTTPSPALSDSPLNTVVRNTDAITVQFGESCGGYTTADMSTVDPSAAISANNSCGTITLGTGTTATTLGTPLIIGNCDTAHIFRASGDTSQNMDKTGAAAALGKTYPAGSEIMPFRSYTYFIRENPAAQPALYRIDNNASAGADELVEGIENMQITYGVGVGARNADGTYPQYQYKDAPAGAEWENVVSVRIVLTARSIDDNLTSASRTYAYNGGANVTDRRLFRNFTTTIGLRNR
jgi:type IV pilus assembly protein PilW